MQVDYQRKRQLRDEEGTKEKFRLRTEFTEEKNIQCIHGMTGNQ